jgi:hypothetical protein
LHGIGIPLLTITFTCPEQLLHATGSQQDTCTGWSRVIRLDTLTNARTWIVDQNLYFQCWGRLLIVFTLWHRTIRLNSQMTNEIRYYFYTLQSLYILDEIKFEWAPAIHCNCPALDTEGPDSIQWSINYNNWLLGHYVVCNNVLNKYKLHQTTVRIKYSGFMEVFPPISEVFFVLFKCNKVLWTP